MTSDPTPTPEPSNYSEVLAYINGNAGLLSLLYDLNLMPEQVHNNPSEQNRMLAMARILWLKEKVERELAEANLVVSTLSKKADKLEEDKEHNARLCKEITEQAERLAAALEAQEEAEIAKADYLKAKDNPPPGFRDASTDDEWSVYISDLAGDAHDKVTVARILREEARAAWKEGRA